MATDERSLSRKDFLRLAGLTAAGAVATACSPATSPTPAATAAAPKAAATSAPGGTAAAKATASADAILAKATDTVVKWKHGIVQPQFNAAFQQFPAERGHWRNEKIDVEFVVQTTDTLLIRALIAGEVDSIEISPQTTMAAIEGGGTVKLVGAFQPGLVHALYVKPEITRLADLAGKKVGITGKGALPDAVLQGVLNKNNLDIYNSLEIVSVPGLPAVVLQLVAGQIDAAAAISVDYFEQVEKAGMKMLVNYAEALPEYLRFTLITTDKTIKERPDVLARWFVGYAKGIRDFITMKEDAIKFAMKVASMDEAAARGNWDYYTSKKLFQPNGYIDPQAITDFQKLNQVIGNQKTIMPVERVMDYSVQKKLIETIGVYPGFAAVS